jgi:hypothetical protein
MGSTGKISLTTPVQTELEGEVADIEARVARIKRALAKTERLLAQSWRSMLWHYFRRKLLEVVTRPRIGGL